MRVKFLDQAKEDIVAHNEHYREIGGAVLSRRMLARIKTPILALSANPEIAPPYELAPGVRRLVVARGGFLVFYRIRADLEVLHIRRAEREPVKTDALEGTAQTTLVEALASMPNVGIDSDFARHT